MLFFHHTPELCKRQVRFTSVQHQHYLSDAAKPHSRHAIGTQRTYVTLLLMLLTTSIIMDKLMALWPKFRGIVGEHQLVILGLVTLCYWLALGYSRSETRKVNYFSCIISMKRI